MKYRPTTGDSSWLIHDRLGMFIHWGIYSLAARHEWVKRTEEISEESYQQYFDHFNPDLHDPAEWAQIAKNAGMKYFVITTKHHDGFCMWDSKLTDYKVTNTPWGKDLIRPMVEAFRAAGLKVGLYHSLIDWHHPQYVIDWMHVLRNAPNLAKLNKNRDQKKYIKYLHGQVRELLTNYGKIDYCFFDFSFAPNADGQPGKLRGDWDSEGLMTMARELQPHLLLDDRLDLLDVPGGFDVRTPEETVVREQLTENGQPIVWETCQTISGYWGYNRDQATYRSVETLLTLLINSVGKGGNLLLNVGPTGRGEIDLQSQDRLVGMGEWMKYHSRSIYGCGPAPRGLTAPQDCRLTYNDKTKRCYVHLLTWNRPRGRLYLDGFAGKVKYAQLLNDASELRFTEAPADEFATGKDPKTVMLELPLDKPKVTFPVVELFMK